MTAAIPRLGLASSLVLHGLVLALALPAFKSRGKDSDELPRSLEVTLLAPFTAPINPIASLKEALSPKPRTTPQASPLTQPATPTKISTAPATPEPAPSRPAVSAPVTPTAEAQPVASTTPPPPGEPALIQRYARLLTDRLNQRNDYPTVAAMRGWQGLVHIRITLSRQGDLIHAQVANSSGFAVLDQHALQRVKDATPLPAIAGALAGDPLQMVIPVQYRLERG